MKGQVDGAVGGRRWVKVRPAHSDRTRAADEQNAHDSGEMTKAQTGGYSVEETLWRSGTGDVERKYGERGRTDTKSESKGEAWSGESLEETEAAEEMTGGCEA